MQCGELARLSRQIKVVPVERWMMGGLADGRADVSSSTSLRNHIVGGAFACAGGRGLTSLVGFNPCM